MDYHLIHSSNLIKLLILTIFFLN